MRFRVLETLRGDSSKLELCLILMRPPSNMTCSILLPTIFLALIAQLTSAAVPRGIHKARVLDEREGLNESYDYIVIGGGTAGLTIADRLTDDEETTVLVIEYGVLSKSRPRQHPVCVEALTAGAYQATLRISRLSAAASADSTPIFSFRRAPFPR